VGGLALAFAAPALATTYYVSPSGADTNAGLAPTSAWRTVGRANQAQLQPGDNVLFQGGQPFTDASLEPPASGTQAGPIRYASYGSGRPVLNGVWVPPGEHDLVFENLELDGAGARANLFGSAGSGSGVYRVTLRGSYVHDSSALGLVSPLAADHDWTIDGNTFQHLGDSGLVILGSGDQVTGNTIADVGWNTAITYSKHGIYAKAPDLTIAGNDISLVRDPTGQAISLRFHGAKVYGNSIHDTADAIDFFDDDTAPAPQGTSYVYDNRFWNISGAGFYYDAPAGSAPSVNFVIASNTFLFSGAPVAVNVGAGLATATVALANNIFSGTFTHGLLGSATTSEQYDLWNGGTSDIPANQGDVYRAPNLAGPPALEPSSSSPGIDAGRTAIPGLSYTPACDGAPLHFCGNAPDLGSIEWPGSATGTAPQTTAAPTFGPASSLRAGTTVAKTSDGSWSGSGPITLTYQWQACSTTSASSCADIAGATGTSYTLTKAQQRQYIRLVVTARNGYGSASATSPLSSTAVGIKSRS
jgi:hypothetical protein